jgi:hypothetical protein
MPTVATLPVYAIPKRETVVTFTLTGSGSNFLRVWVTGAPEKSELTEKLKTSTQNRFEVYEGDGGVNNPWRTTFDKGGKYTFTAQEYKKGSGYGGGYQFDPASAPSETKVDGEATLSLYIGQKYKVPVGAPPDTVTLIVWCWQDNIRATTLATHGEISPRLDSDSPTPKAKAAMEASTVLAAVAALKDQPYTTVSGSIATIVAEMVDDINAHYALGATTHNAADADNVLKLEYKSAPGPHTLQEFVNAALASLRRHYTNDTGGTTTTPPGVGSAAYHQISAVGKSDLTNMPLYTSVGSLAEAYAALADIWRAHEAHRVSTAVHGTADATNTLTALPLLLQVHRQYLTVQAAFAPAAAPAQSNMGNLLVTQCGFEEEE